MRYAHTINQQEQLISKNERTINEKKKQLKQLLAEISRLNVSLPSNSNQTNSQA
jgi:hypothetical protein